MVTSWIQNTLDCGDYYYYHYLLLLLSVLLLFIVVTVQPASPYAGTDRLATLHRSGPVPVPGQGPGPGPPGATAKKANQPLPTPFTYFPNSSNQTGLSPFPQL